MDPKDVQGDDKSQDKDLNKENKGQQGQDGGNDKAEVSISKQELDSIKKSHQEAQKLIKQYEKEKKEKEAQEDDAKRKKMEDDGQIKELLDQTKSELTEKASLLEKLQGENELFKTTLQKISENKISKFEEGFGREKLEEIKSIVGEDPITLAEKLDSFEKILGAPKGKLPADEKGTPQGKGGVDRMKELQDKAGKSGLTRPEQNELLRLTANL